MCEPVAAYSSNMSRDEPLTLAPRFNNQAVAHALTYTSSSPVSGNYDTFKKTVADNEVVQQKKYEKEQEDIKHIKEFIASCGASCFGT
jgi:hypothetical protein